MADPFYDLLFERARRAQRDSVRRRARRKKRAHARAAVASGDALPGTALDDEASMAMLRECGDQGDIAEAAVARVPDPGARRLSPTQKIGREYEDRALALLVRAGLQPLARNLGTRVGEIDLALRDGETLVLVEVRARADAGYGGAAASVGWAKQARVARAAQRLLPGLAARHWAGRPPRVRFDVVAFDDETPRWLRHAFDVPMR